MSDNTKKVFIFNDSFASIIYIGCKQVLFWYLYTSINYSLLDAEKLFCYITPYYNIVDIYLKFQFTRD